MRGLLLCVTLTPVAFLAACGFAEEPVPTLPVIEEPVAPEVPPPPPPPPTLEERFLDGVPFALDPAGSMVDLTVALGDATGSPTPVSLGAWSGQSTAKTDGSGRLVIRAMAIEGGELVVTPE